MLSFPKLVIVFLLVMPRSYSILLEIKKGL